MSNDKGFLSPGDAESLDSSYFAANTCSSQWRSFLGALAIELHLGSEGGEVRNFLRAVGGRMANSLPLPKVETLEQLEAAMNKIWREIDWGWVRLGVVDDKIWIAHGAYPNAISDGEEQIWPQGAASVLEGVYTAWLSQQGSPGRRTVRISDKVRPLEFHHGV